MPNPSYRPPPPPTNPFTNPASLSNWMTGISKAKWELERQKKEAREHLTPLVRRSKPEVTPQQQQVLKQYLASLRRKEITLSADGARRLQATLRSARTALAAAGTTNRQTINALYSWESFLEQARAAP
jgi:phosphoglycerate-specific signal transduction histidine kinase